jgi:hypothetical protein
MEVWVVILFLAGEKIRPDYDFETKKDCIEYGKAAVESYKRYFTHSTGWFWCVKERRI